MWEYSKTGLVAPEVQLGRMCNWIVGPGAIQVPSVTSYPYLRVRAAFQVVRNGESEVQLERLCNWIVGGAIQVPSVTSNPYLRVRAAFPVVRNGEDKILRFFLTLTRVHPCKD